MDLFFTNTKLFTSQDVIFWGGVVWITCGFLSAVWTLILMALIHFRGSNDEQVINAKFIQKKKQTHQHIGCLRVSILSKC